MVDSGRGKIDPYEEIFKPRPLWDRIMKAHGGLPSPFKTPIGFSMMSPPSCTKWIEKKEKD